MGEADSDEGGLWNGTREQLVQKPLSGTRAGAERGPCGWSAGNGQEQGQGRLSWVL